MGRNTQKPFHKINSLNVGKNELSGQWVSNPVNPHPRMIILNMIALAKALIFRSFRKISLFRQDKLKQNMIG